MLVMKPDGVGSGWYDINATRIIVSALGVILGISGFCHGFFEALQGNTPTNGMLIHAIGEANRMWAYGNEPAFTVIPNFLVTGIAAMIVSLAVITWSVGFIQKKNGPLVFLILFILLFLVGGGIGQIIIFTMGWAFATRINKPLAWWRKALPAGVRRALAGQWLACVTISSLLLLFALEIAIFGFVPGVSNPDLITVYMLASLGSSLILFLLAFISGLAHDIERQGICNRG